MISSENLHWNMRCEEVMKFLKYDLIFAGFILGVSINGIYTSWWGFRAIASSGEFVKTAECPVCKMRIEITPDTPKTMYKGKIFYFMDENMKIAFEREPNKYLF